MFHKTPKVSQERRRPTTPGNSVVFSYHANRSAQLGPQGRTSEADRTATAVRRAKRAGWFRRGPMMAAGILLVMLLLFNMVLSSKARVVTIGDARGTIFLRNQETYTEAAQQVLGASVFNKTKLTANTGHIAQELQTKFPELQSVSVSVPLVGHQPTVYIQPASPKLLLSTTDGSMYVVDNLGRALIVASQVPHLEKLGLPVVSDQSGLAVKPGSNVLPSTSVFFITEIVGQLRAKNLTITSLTLPAGTSELDVKIGGAPYTVKFNLRGDARAEAGAFLAVKQELETGGKAIPSSYIDVRVEDRVYYR